MFEALPEPQAATKLLLDAACDWLDDNPSISSFIFFNARVLSLKANCDIKKFAKIEKVSI